MRKVSIKQAHTTFFWAALAALCWTALMIAVAVGVL